MMLIIPGYHVKEQLYESAHSMVYRARRSADDLPVVLKVLREEYPPPEEVICFKREYKITRNLEVDGVIDVYDLEPYKNTLMMVLEDLLNGRILLGIIRITRLMLLFVLMIALVVDRFGIGITINGIRLVLIIRHIKVSIIISTMVSMLFKTRLIISNGLMFLKTLVVNGI